MNWLEMDGKSPCRSALRHISLFVLAVASCATPVAGQTTDETVAQFFPQALVDLNNEIQTPLVRRQCFEVLAVDAAGSAETIFAAYTDRYLATVRVLRKRAGGFEVVAEPEGLELWAADCKVSLVDIDRNGQKEVHLSLFGAANTVDWLFSWDGLTLQNLTPNTDTGFGSLSSRLNNVDFVDIDGDGVLELSSLTLGGGSDSIPARKVFRWLSGQYVETDSVVGPWIFVRSSSTPTTIRIPFERPASAQGPFLLVILNGSTVSNRVENAVESARVWLNGEEFFVPLISVRTCLLLRSRRCFKLKTNLESV